ncbi:unnamed protein product, partial [marine sediment metagenome]
MGFTRALVSPSGNLKQPLRAGDGWVSNVSPKVYAAE